VFAVVELIVVVVAELCVCSARAFYDHAASRLRVDCKSVGLQSLEWCQRILRSYERERWQAVGMASVDRLARDSALRSIANAEPGLIDMILQYI
jgi:hypothetical protein